MSQIPKVEKYFVETVCNDFLLKNRVHLQRVQKKKKSINVRNILAIKRRVGVPNVMQWNKFTICLLE